MSHSLCYCFVLLCIHIPVQRSGDIAFSQISVGFFCFCCYILLKNLSAVVTGFILNVKNNVYVVQLDSCRKTQYAFDKCMLEKLGIERPFVGYFSKIRVHHTNRPKPEVHVEMPETFHRHPTYDPKDPIPEISKKRTQTNLIGN